MKKRTSKIDKSLLPVERVEGVILVVRGQKVILDADLAELYGVNTKRLNEQVKRNRDRFPEDFMFRLTKNESENLKSHFATSSSAWGGRRNLPHAFTEHGAIMVASILNTPQAVQAGVFVVRAFVRLRDMLGTHKQLARKLEELETKFESHDESIRAIFAAIQQLMTPPEKPRKEIGFKVKEKIPAYNKPKKT
jgi:hypothetical protein